MQWQARPVLIDESTAVSDVAVLRPGRRIEIAAAPMLGNSVQTAVGVTRLDPGARGDPHQHDGSEEIVVVLSGSAAFTVDGVAHELAVGDAILIPAGAKHAVDNRSNTEARVLWIYAPSGPERALIDTHSDHIER